MFDSAIIKLEDAIWGIDKYFQSNAQQIFGEDFIVDFAGLSGIELNHDRLIFLYLPVYLPHHHPNPALKRLSVARFYRRTIMGTPLHKST